MKKTTVVSRPPFFFKNLLRFSAILFMCLAAVMYVNRDQHIFGQTANTARTLPLRLGTHSADPSIAYFQRNRDPNGDRRGAVQRTNKDQKMRGNYGELYDPGLVVNGRSHDLSMRFVDYVTQPEALPSNRATAIVIGTLSTSHGFVNDEHSGVYTEHQFNVEQVLKSDDPSLVTGAQVIGTRLGGTVLFPSGHLKDYVIHGEGVPKANTRYLLFLWRPADHDDNELDYGICTAYELNNGKAYALDAVVPYTQYEGIGEPALLAEVVAELQKGGN